eukprot:TRINITY_DN362_c3_g2_i1.p1 TRINITY_DN362_c3_g2~~TRINITY_DN362_c3_g2_i1.p1  ORF type:complete len:345 (-),score=79.11 TRINITY_DN362_c3_g2_i1:504-1538(-)
MGNQNDTPQRTNSTSSIPNTTAAANNPRTRSLTKLDDGNRGSLPPRVQYQAPSNLIYTSNNPRQQPPTAMEYHPPPPYTMNAEQNNSRLPPPHVMSYQPPNSVPYQPPPNVYPPPPFAASYIPTTSPAGPSNTTDSFVGPSFVSTAPPPPLYYVPGAPTKPIDPYGYPAFYPPNPSALPPFGNVSVHPPPPSSSSSASSSPSSSFFAIPATTGEKEKARANQRDNEKDEERDFLVISRGQEATTSPAASAPKAVAPKATAPKITVPLRLPKPTGKAPTISSSTTDAKPQRGNRRRARVGSLTESTPAATPSTSSSAPRNRMTIIGTNALNEVVNQQKALETMGS